MSRNEARSKCCDASVRTEGSTDFIGDEHPKIMTCYYVCEECGKPCDVQEDNVVLARTNVATDWLIKITKVNNGFIVEHLEELMGNTLSYHRVQDVFESPEFDPDDLEAFQKVVYHLKDLFGVEIGTGRRLDLEIYDPDAKQKKGKK